MPEDTVRHWQSLTAAEIPGVVEQDPVVVLPLAAVEQHGPHLPLSTDLEIGLGLLRHAFGCLPDRFPAWVLPAQGVGSSREHARFPGTLSLEAGLLVDLIHQQGTALAGCGVRRLVIANSHGGNRHVLDAAALRLRDERSMLVVKASYYRVPPPATVDLPASEWRHGLHGGAVETAMMMHLRPDLVRSHAIATRRSLGEDLAGRLRRLGPEGEVSFGWLAGDLDASGVVGNARLATADMGERLVAHYGAALADVIQDARAFPLERLR